MTTGQMLAHYRIQERLGAGGMGVVYKALDTHLDRLVAIKVLAADAVADPTRRQRFIQEARAASALDHPNIVTIHDIAEVDGRLFMVMQYVAGKTLRAVLDHGRLEPGEALRHAIAISDALSQAHARGIVHRDLKPENLMVTDQGHIKILDFGPALLTEPAEGDPSGPTVSLPEPRHRTEQGTVLGTVAYMSPEQAEGRRVDSRSDIFSLGLVLYEMFTGRRAFRADSKAAMLAAILREEPKPVTELVPGSPPEVERIVARCLRKDPTRRFQHMDDLKVALQELKEESESGKLATGAAPAARRPWLVPAVIAAVVVLTAVVAGAWWFIRTSPPMSSRGPLLTRLTSDPGLTTEPTFSADGKLVAYASDRAGGGNLDIWVQQLAGGEAHRITTDPADDREPAFSPDGGRIAFQSEREGGGIYVVSTFGGAARKIAGEGYRPLWSPDGQWIVYWVGERAAVLWSDGKAYVVPSAGGAPRLIQPDFAAVWQPIWSPDGKRLLFPGVTRARPPEADWWVAPVDGGSAVKTGALDMLRTHKLATQTLIAAASFQPVPGAWIGNRVVFAAPMGDSINLWQVPISPRDFRIAGPPQRLTSGAAVEADPSVWAGPRITRLVFSSLAQNVDLWSLSIDPNQAKVRGEPQRLTTDVAPDIRPSISPDGRQLVFNSYRAGNWDVWRKDLSSGQETALTATPVQEENPRITPDGSQVIYRVREGDRFTAYLLPASGGLPRILTQECNAVFPWASDGRRFLCAVRGAMHLFDAVSGEKKALIRPSGAAARLSWDDRWLTFYRLTEPGRSRIYIAPVRDGPPLEEKDWIAVTDGQKLDLLPEFSPDGNTLYFMSHRDGTACLWAQRLDRVTRKPVETPFAVQHFHSARRSPSYVHSGQRAISIARNQIVFTMEERTGNIWMAELEDNR